MDSIELSLHTGQHLVIDLTPDARAVCAEHGADHLLPVLISLVPA